jgi:hypothetical protein
MLKIIIIIIGYTLNNFTTHIIVDDGKIHNFKKKKFNHFFEKKNLFVFVNVETNRSLWYQHHQISFVRSYTYVIKGIAPCEPRSCEPRWNEHITQGANKC